MSDYPAPSPVYVGPAAHTSAGSNYPITRIVIHGTVSPCVKGGARSVARFFAEQSTQGSAHYIVDPGEVVQDVYDAVIAWHAPPNQGSIGVELCDPETGPASRWDDADHTAMLERAAELVAGLCLAYNVPVRKIGPKGLLAGHHGICGHVDVSNAWHQSDHSDPRGFPWQKFMRMVREERDKQMSTHERRGKRPARKRDAAVTTRPERADKKLAGAENQLEDVQGPRRQRLVAPILDLVRRARRKLHRKLPDTRNER